LKKSGWLKSSKRQSKKKVGTEPTGTVVTTLLFDVLMTETAAEKLFATYANDPSGVNAIPKELDWTGIVAVTMLVAASTTETEFPL
jgi:hypothetical protein